MLRGLIYSVIRKGEVYLAPAILLILLFLLSMPLHQHLSAQDATPTPSVPDVTGLSLPQAAAALHRAGYALAQPTFIEGQPPQTVAEQSPVAGENAAPGTAVAVTVAQAFNARLVWDDNDFTIINETGDVLRLDQLRFSSDAAAYTGRWPENVVNDGFCAQVWTEPVRSAKEVPGCQSARSTLWLTSNDRTEHFWTNGATQFEVYQDGVYRGRCEVAALECRLYLAPGLIPEDVTPYLYFNYTEAALLVVNTSQTRWMPLDRAVIDTLLIGNVSQFSSGSIGNPALLAPGECELFISGSGETSIAWPEAQPCLRIADAAVQDPVWRDGFTLVSTLDGQPRTCPPAVANEVTICLLPR
ncbi:MAG: PASTA domain-containing protein [bacterium]|nr:PASTA domain-containing protein [bacterium]